MKYLSNLSKNIYFLLSTHIMIASGMGINIISAN